MSSSHKSDTTLLSDSKFSAEINIGIEKYLQTAALLHSNSGISFIKSEKIDPVTVSYPELLQSAKKIAGGLARLGYPRGTTACLLLDDPEEFIPTFWGCILSGFVPCTLAPIKNDAERWERHLHHVKSLLTDPLVITTQSWSNELIDMSTVDIALLKSADMIQGAETVANDDVAMFVLTSGSTGNAKGVTLTHGNIHATMRGKQGIRKLTSDDRVLNWIPLDHVASIIESHLIAVYAGAQWMHVDAALVIADPLLLLRLINKFRVTVSLAPNFLLGQINAVLEDGKDIKGRGLKDCDLSCVRQIITGGEANVVETAVRFATLLEPYGMLRAALWPGFGMTETCAGVIYSNDFPDIDAAAAREFSSFALPIEGIEIRIADRDGYYVKEGESGELQLRGPMVFAGYFNNPEENLATRTADGWFRTGDSGILSNGRLQLAGRSKECIIVNGINYYSQELEAAIEPLDGIEPSYVAVFAIRPKGADTEQAVVMFAPNFSDDEDRLYRLLVAIRSTSVLLWGFRPSLILPLSREKFPRTSLGKIQRSLLRKQMEAGEIDNEIDCVSNIITLQLGGYSAPETEEEHLITRIFADIFEKDVKSISATSSFFDLGGTSLDIIRLTAKLSKQFDVQAQMATILQNPSPRMLGRYVEAEHARGNHAVHYTPIVTLQRSGAKTPLFCIHSAIGEILVFVNLAKYFVNERPFHALRARGLDNGQQLFSSLPELIDTYVSAIREVQPHGPYALAGYSFGGIAAFEIMKRLEADGETVAFFCSIDCAPCTIEPICPDYCAISLGYFLGLINHSKMLELHAQFKGSDETICERIMAVANSKRVAELDLDLPKFKNWIRVAVSLGLMGRDYKPSGKVSSVTVLYATPRWVTPEHWLEKQLKQWDMYTNRPNRYIKVGGEHHSLMEPEYLQQFQLTLRSEIARISPDF